MNRLDPSDSGAFDVADSRDRVDGGPARRPARSPMWVWKMGAWVAVVVLAVLIFAPRDWTIGGKVGAMGLCWLLGMAAMQAFGGLGAVNDRISGRKEGERPWPKTDYDESPTPPRNIQDIGGGS